MKKIVLLFSILAVIPAKAHASHQALINAANITVGILPNERLDPSSVTLLGPNPQFQNLTATATSLSAFQTAFSTNSIHAGNTNYMELSGSTQTKIGGLQLIGNMQASSGTFYNGGIFSSGSIRMNAGSNRVLEIVAGVDTNGSIPGQLRFASSSSGGVSISNTTGGGGNLRIQDISGGDDLLLGASGMFVRVDAGDGLRVTSLSANQDCIGTGANKELVDGTCTGGSSTGGGVSTFTVTIQSGGDVFTATNTFIPISGAFKTVGKSTYNVLEIRAFNNYTSSGTTAYQLAKSTVTSGLYIPWQYATERATVTANQRYSVWYSTFFQVYPNETLALHIPSTTANAIPQAAEFGIDMRVMVTGGGD